MGHAIVKFSSPKGWFQNKNKKQQYWYFFVYRDFAVKYSILFFHQINTIQNKLEETHTKNGWQLTTQTWREKKYRKTTYEMGRWFSGGRNRPKGLTLIDDDIIRFHFTIVRIWTNLKLFWRLTKFLIKLCKLSDLLHLLTW